MIRALHLFYEGYGTDFVEEVEEFLKAGVIVVWAICFATSALVYDGARAGLHPPGFDPTIADNG